MRDQRMEFLTREQCLDWLTSHGIDLAGAPLHDQPRRRWSFRIVGDSGKKTALSRAVIGHIAGQGTALFIVTVHGVWPSSEDMVHFDGYRRSLGEGRSLDQVPGVLFTAKDVAVVAPLLALGFYFVWGGIIVAPGNGLRIEFSSDEVLEVAADPASADGERLAESVGRILGPPFSAPEKIGLGHE